MKILFIVLFCIVVWGAFVAVPVFGAVLGTLLAGYVLWILMTEID